MAIYDLGTASLAANGEVTGVGTTWKAPLTLIRVGATIVFKTEPVQIYTIAEIISDTQVNVYNPNSETVPAGTGYAILAHDGITVQGLAQDVAETLRFYQSRETEVATAVDVFKDFDQDKFSTDVSQVNTQYGEIITTGSQVANYAAQVSSDKDSAAASASSASSYKDAAAASAQEAADYAASLDTENLLRKDLSLSDLTDKALARVNLDVYSKGEIDSMTPDSGIVATLSSMSELRAYSVSGLSAGSSVKLNSHLGTRDYGGGFFVWKPASTNQDDNGYWIKPNSIIASQQGRWFRQSLNVYSVRTVSPLEFGARIDDSSFDCSVAINAAIKYLNPYTDASMESAKGGDVVLENGVYYINDTIYGSPNVRIIGTGSSVGFRSSRAGASVIMVMSTMDTSKVMYDTAPYLISGGRYTRTDELIYGRTESNGYYGASLENITFVGNAQTQAAVRIWRVPTSKLNSVNVYNCKVSYWINGSWDITIRDCFSYGASYSTFLFYQSTAIRVFGGYFTGGATLASEATKQWFHRDISGSNKGNIAFVTNFAYCYNTFDIDFYGVTAENYNKPFALFYSSNVNLYGGYYEHLAPPDSETGRRVMFQCVASRVISRDSYFNNANMDLVVQSGNVIDSSGYVESEISQVKIINPKVVNKFININKDLGYGSYDIEIDSSYPVTQSLNTTLSSYRSYSCFFKNLADLYTRRSVAPVIDGTTSFSFSIGNIIPRGEYDVRISGKDQSVSRHFDVRFVVFVGGVIQSTSFEARSITGNSILTAPTVSYSSNTLTFTFSGNGSLYSQFLMEVIPRISKPILTF